MKKKRPALRFSGFDNDWEQRKLGDVSDSYSGGTPTADVSEYYGGQIPFIRSAEINSVITELFLTEGGLKNSSARLVEMGDILYALYGATSGEVGRARLTGAINQAILAIKPHGGYDSEYIAQWLRKSKHSIIETYLQGGQGNLSGAIVKELSVDFPTLKEQQVIGAFFKQLDHLITLHRCECKKLICIKKSVLENMFPQKGEKIPRIRFSGFTDDWEQRKLGDIVERVTCKNENNESALPLTISAQYGLIDQNEFFDKRIASKDISGYYLIHKGEFAYNKSTSSDAPCGAIKRLDRYKSGVLSTLYIVFKILDESKINSNYLVTYYDTFLWHKGVRAIAAEGARNHGLLNIAPVDFFKTTVLMPKSIGEQREIGLYFKRLDHLITLHQRKLGKLQNIKKAMLEKMFV